MQLSAVRIMAVLLPLFCTACSLLNEPRFACNPVRSAGDSGCKANEKCAVVVADQLQATECQENGGNGFGDSACRPTGGSDDCTAGWVCVQTNAGKGADNLCRFICRIGVDSDCGDPNCTPPTCIPPADGPHVCKPANAELAKYGFCCPRSGC